MDLVDSKYIGLVSSRLPKFKKIKANLYNFRCPVCGDSQKHKNKARGYLYGIKSNVNFRCHNCGASMSFNNFLKQIDPTLQKQYAMEKFKEGHAGGRNFVVEEPKLIFESPKFKPKVDLPKASENPQAKQYLENRKLDSTKFYYTDKFKAWSNSHKHTFDDLTYDEPRIIIPLIYQNTLVGFQGRSLVPNKVKYITVMLKEEAPKVYGMDQIEKGRSVYVVEGPFDSTFIKNSIALCGSDGDLEHFEAYDFIYTYDNEPRNKEIVGRIERCIERNQRVVIWPNNIKEKDINEMVLAGHDVQSVVELNVYDGLKAKLQFNTWKRI
jgi:ssDNA-binding Zn-finger/Zn-ribbon topoisomerase 1